MYQKTKTSVKLKGGGPLRCRAKSTSCRIKGGLPNSSDQCQNVPLSAETILRLAKRVRTQEILTPISISFAVFQFEEFNAKMKSGMSGMVPISPPKRESHGRTDFEGFRDLFDYIIGEDEKQKQSKTDS